MPNSSKRHTGVVVAKPHKDFPLFAHQSGRWAKKIKGKLVYFGSTQKDPDGTAALERWLREKDHLLAGRTPPAAGVTGVTVKYLCNRFMASKQGDVALGEITQRTLDDYHQIGVQLIKFFGADTLVEHLTPDDFRKYKLRVAQGGFGRSKKKAKQLSAVSLKNEINRARVIFNFGHKSGLLDRPAAFGIEFNRPKQRQIKLQRAERGQKYFDAAELRKLLDEAATPLKAMLLLGVNCGLGNREIGMLRFRNLDLKSGWLNYPRNKTGINRRAKLWPETIAAIQEAIDQRREPLNENDSELVFITRCGQAWCKATSDSPIANEFTKLADRLNVKRPGLSFYSLRHTTETIGGGCRDQVAVDFVMGHAPESDDMSANYRHHIGDDRLEAVADYIHAWLFAEDEAEGEAPTTIKFRKAK